MYIDLRYNWFSLFVTSCNWWGIGVGGGAGGRGGGKEGKEYIEEEWEMDVSVV